VNLKRFVQLVGVKAQHLEERLKLKNASAELGIQCSFCTFLTPKHFSCLKTLPDLFFFLFLFPTLLVVFMGWGRIESFYQVATPGCAQDLTGFPPAVPVMSFFWMLVGNNGNTFRLGLF